MSASVSPVSVTRIARYCWAARQGEKYGMGTSEAAAIKNLEGE